MRIYPFPMVSDVQKCFPSAIQIKSWAFGKAYSLEIDRRPYLIIDESILWELYGDEDPDEGGSKPDLISLVEFDNEGERGEYLGLNLNFAADCLRDGGIKMASIQEPVKKLRLGSMVSFASTRCLMIRDDYDSLSWKAPVERWYCLRRGDQSFFGDGLFGAGETECFQRFNIETISIPRDIMDAIFLRLENIHILTGNYMPRIFRNSESISLGIYLDTGDDRVVLSTQSQGRYHKPWGVRVGGKGYVYNGRQISRVLRDLRPFFKRETFARLCQGVKILSRPFWDT